VLNPRQAKFAQSHQSFFCAMFVSKPAPDCNDPVFVQPFHIEPDEAPAVRQVVLHVYAAGLSVLAHLALKTSVTRCRGDQIRALRHLQREHAKSWRRE
jgi:hypothetical protein